MLCMDACRYQSGPGEFIEVAEGPINGIGQCADMLAVPLLSSSAQIAPVRLRPGDTF